LTVISPEVAWSTPRTAVWARASVLKGLLALVPLLLSLPVGET
jgi:hypothetical protein